MMKTLKQARAALSMLSPDEVRNAADRPLHIGLVAASGSGYAEMEDFLVPADLPRHMHANLLRQVHHAADRDVPREVDLVLYEYGIPAPRGTYIFDRQNLEGTIASILHDHHQDFGLALARQFPAFRRSVVERIVKTISRENALFAAATALPNILPSFIELPWAVSEFASDTVFLTANQIRMAFLIAAACGKDVGFKRQGAEIASIAAGAFGWRAIARELVGKIPLGGGLIPKGAIAYAGTFLVGKGLEHLHHANRPYTNEERNAVYVEAYEHGRAIAESVKKKAVN
jgi:uncharacterized protein (DUF697 family)